MNDELCVQDRGQPRYDHIKDPVSGGINAQVGQSSNIEENQSFNLDLVVWVLIGSLTSHNPSSFVQLHSSCQSWVVKY